MIMGIRIRRDGDLY